MNQETLGILDLVITVVIAATCAAWAASKAISGKFEKYDTRFDRTDAQLKELHDIALSLRSLVIRIEEEVRRHDKSIREHDDMLQDWKVQKMAREIADQRIAVRERIEAEEDGTVARIRESGGV